MSVFSISSEWIWWVGETMHLSPLHQVFYRAEENKNIYQTLIIKTKNVSKNYSSTLSTLWRSGSCLKQIQRKLRCKFLAPPPTVTIIMG